MRFFFFVRGLALGLPEALGEATGAGMDAEGADELCGAAGAVPVTGRLGPARARSIAACNANCTALGLSVWPGNNTPDGGGVGLTDVPAEELSVLPDRRTTPPSGRGSALLSRAACTAAVSAVPNDLDADAGLPHMPLNPLKSSIGTRAVGAAALAPWAACLSVLDTEAARELGLELELRTGAEEGPEEGPGSGAEVEVDGARVRACAAFNAAARELIVVAVDGPRLLLVLVGV